MTALQDQILLFLDDNQPSLTCQVMVLIDGDNDEEDPPIAEERKHDQKLQQTAHCQTSPLHKDSRWPS